MKNKHNLSILINIFILILWQILAMIINAHYILPSPIQILYKIWELKTALFTVHLPYTMLITLLGLLISIALGVFFAIIMDMSTQIKNVIYPLIISSQTIPVTAIAPLFILWFGYGIWSKVVVTVLITFFPIVIATYDGFKYVKSDMQDLLITYGANKRQIFFMLKLKSAMPNFFSAIKMSIPISIIGAAIGEWLGSQKGLGYFSKRMLTQLDGAGVFAPVVLLSLVAMLIVNLAGYLEKKIITWEDKI